MLCTHYLGTQSCIETKSSLVLSKQLNNTVGLFHSDEYCASPWH